MGQAICLCIYGLLFADRAAANRCVILYLTLPMLISFGPILDARPLGTLITTSFVAAIVHQATRGSGLWVMVFLAALAPFARPEGVLFPMLAGCAAWLLGQSRIRSILLAAIALLPNILFRSNFRGMTGHEQLFGPWYGTWATWDMLALFGPAAAPTKFREFALKTVELGVVDGRPGGAIFVGALVMAPAGVVGAILIIAGAIGLIDRGRTRFVGAAPQAPLVVLAWCCSPRWSSVLPFPESSRTQPTPFLMPGILALVRRQLPKTWPRWARDCWC